MLLWQTPTELWIWCLYGLILPFAYFLQQINLFVSSFSAKHSFQDFFSFRPLPSTTHIAMTNPSYPIRRQLFGYLRKLLTVLLISSVPFVEHPNHTFFHTELWYVPHLGWKVNVIGRFFGHRVVFFEKRCCNTGDGFWFAPAMTRRPYVSVADLRCSSLMACEKNV